MTAPATDRAGDSIEIKPWRSGKGEQWVGLAITRGGEQVFAATCWDRPEAEMKRDLWIAGAPVDVIENGSSGERERWLAARVASGD